MLSLFAMPMHRAVEHEIDTHLHQIHVPNSPKISVPTRSEIFLLFNSGLWKYYNPVYPSPLMFILLSLEFFLFLIALFFRGACLCGAWNAVRSTIPLRHRNTIGPNSVSGYGVMVTTDKILILIDLWKW